MNGFALLVTAAVLGVDYGWQPDADGQLEYIIQIEPVTLIALRDGQEIVSRLDPYVRNVRRFRIRVGTEMVPRRGTPPREPPTDPSPNATLGDIPGIQFGWQPIDERQMEFFVQIAPDRYASMRNGEDIVGRFPADVQNLARIRILSGIDPLPKVGLPSAEPTTLVSESAPTNEPAPLIPAPAIVAGPQTANTTPAAAPLDSASHAASPGDVGVPNVNTPSAITSPALGDATGSTVSNSQLNSHYLSMADATKKKTNMDVAPSIQQPASLTPGMSAPPTGTSQLAPVMGDPARGVPMPPPQGTIRVNDNRGSTWATPPPDRAVRVPQPLDTARRIESTGGYAADRGAAFSPFSSPPAVSRGQDDYSPGVLTSFAGSQRAFGAESHATTEDASSLRVPDTLAAALGFDAWPNRVSSKDFWSSLTATANDRSLDYLRGESPGWPLTLAVFALFASIGGNLFLGWVTLDIYRRSLDLADDAIDPDRYESPDDRDEGDTWSEKRRHRARSRARV
jgi:hypothetical protein